MVPSNVSVAITQDWNSSFHGKFSETFTDIKDDLTVDDKEEYQNNQKQFRYC